MSQLSLTFVLLLTSSVFTLRSSAILASQFNQVWSFVPHKHSSSVVIFLCHRESKLSHLTLHTEEFTEIPEVSYDLAINVSTQRPYPKYRSHESKTCYFKRKKGNRLENQILGNMLCVLDRASSWYLHKGWPTGWHLLYYILLNMFQTLIRPSSGASEYLLCCVGWLGSAYTRIPHRQQTIPVHNINTPQVSLHNTTSTR